MCRATIDLLLGFARCVQLAKAASVLAYVSLAVDVASQACPSWDDNPLCAAQADTEMKRAAIDATRVEAINLRNLQVSSPRIFDFAIVGIVTHGNPAAMLHAAPRSV